MPKCLIILPWSSGSVSFPGLTESELSQVTGYTCGSYAPPPPGAANYALVWLTASQAVIDKLSARSDCLYVCAVLLDADGNQTGFETAALNATARNSVRSKLEAMGFTGAIYGLLNAAIQASQTRDDLAVAIATKAFFRDIDKTYMTVQDVRGTV